MIDPALSFEMVAMPHLPAAYNLARWLLRDDQNAEDVVQEGYLRAFRFFKDVQGDNVRPWLLGIVRNACFDWLRQHRHLDNQLELDELRDTDAVSMAHSLEVRVPFLDPQVADTALSLPEAARLAPPQADAPEGSYRATGVKRVIVDVAQRWLPPEFGDRAKRGFGVPMDAWLNGELKSVLHESLSPERVARRGLLDAGAVTDTLTAFHAGTVHWSLPWLLLALELWGEQVLDGGRQ